MMPGETNIDTSTGTCPDAVTGTCSNCTALQQNLNEYVDAFIALKQKIIDTDHLITDYQQKCEDLQNAERECNALRWQVEQMLHRFTEMEKIQEEMATLKIELDEKRSSLKLYQNTVVEYNHLKEDQQKRDVERKKVDGKVKKLEDTVQKQKEECKELKMGKKALERDLKQTKAKLEMVEQQNCNKSQKVSITRETQTYEKEMPVPFIDKKKVKLLLEQLWMCIEPSNTVKQSWSDESMLEPLNIQDRNVVDVDVGQSCSSPVENLEAPVPLPLLPVLPEIEDNEVDYMETDTSFEEDKPSFEEDQQPCDTDTVICNDNFGELPSEKTENSNSPHVSDNVCDEEQENGFQTVQEILEWVKPLPPMLSPLRSPSCTGRRALFGDITDSSDEEKIRSINKHGHISEDNESPSLESMIVQTEDIVNEKCISSQTNVYDEDVKTLITEKTLNVENDIPTVEDLTGHLQVPTLQLDSCPSAKDLQFEMGDHNKCETDGQAFNVHDDKLVKQNGIQETSTSSKISNFPLPFTSNECAEVLITMQDIPFQKRPDCEETSPLSNDDSNDSHVVDVAGQPDQLSSCVLQDHLKVKIAKETDQLSSHESEYKSENHSMVDVPEEYDKLSFHESKYNLKVEVAKDPGQFSNQRSEENINVCPAEEQGHLSYQSESIFSMDITKKADDTSDHKGQAKVEVTGDARQPAAHESEGSCMVETEEAHQLSVESDDSCIFEAMEEPDDFSDDNCEDSYKMNAEKSIEKNDLSQTVVVMANAGEKRFHLPDTTSESFECNDEYLQGGNSFKTVHIHNDLVNDEEYVYNKNTVSSYSALEHGLMKESIPTTEEASQTCSVDKLDIFNSAEAQYMGCSEEVCKKAEKTDGQSYSDSLCDINTPNVTFMNTSVATPGSQVPRVTSSSPVYDISMDHSYFQNISATSSHSSLERNNDSSFASLPNEHLKPEIELKWHSEDIAFTSVAKLPPGTQTLNPADELQLPFTANGSVTCGLNSGFGDSATAEKNEEAIETSKKSSDCSQKLKEKFSAVKSMPYLEKTEEVEERGFCLKRKVKTAKPIQSASFTSKMYALTKKIPESQVWNESSNSEDVTDRVYDKREVEEAQPDSTKYNNITNNGNESDLCTAKVLHSPLKVTEVNSLNSSSSSTSSTTGNVCDHTYVHGLKTAVAASVDHVSAINNYSETNERTESFTSAHLSPSQACADTVDSSESSLSFSTCSEGISQNSEMDISPVKTEHCDKNVLPLSNTEPVSFDATGNIARKISEVHCNAEENLHTSFKSLDFNCTEVNQPVSSDKESSETSVPFSRIINGDLEETKVDSNCSPDTDYTVKSNESFTDGCKLNHLKDGENLICSMPSERSPSVVHCQEAQTSMHTEKHSDHDGPQNESLLQNKAVAADPQVVNSLSQSCDTFEFKDTYTAELESFGDTGGKTTKCGSSKRKVRKPSKAVSSSRNSKIQCNNRQSLDTSQKKEESEIRQIDNADPSVCGTAGTSSYRKCSPESLNKVRFEMGPPLPPLLLPLTETPPRSVNPVSPPSSTLSQSSLPSPLEDLVSPLRETAVTRSVLHLVDKSSLGSPDSTTLSPSDAAKRILSSPLQFCAATPKHAVPVPGRLPPSASVNSAPTAPQENSVKILDTMYPELSARARTLNILKGNIQLNRCCPTDNKSLPGPVSQISSFKAINSGSTAFVKTANSRKEDSSCKHAEDLEIKVPGGHGKKRTAVDPVLPRSAKKLQLDGDSGSESNRDDADAFAKPSENASTDVPSDASENVCRDLTHTTQKVESNSTSELSSALPQTPVPFDPDKDAVTEALKKIAESCFDLLPVIRCHVLVGNISKLPVLREEEKQVVHEFTQVNKNLAEPLLLAIFQKLKTEKKTMKHGYIQALCRVYTAICRQQGDLERARLLAFCVLKEGFPESEVITLSILSAWKDILSLNAVLNKAMQAVLKQRAKGEVLKCLSAYLNWEKNHVLDVPCLLASVLASMHFVNEMTFQLNDQYGEDLTATMWDYILACELLCSQQGWAWTHDHIISKELWPVMDKWIKYRKGNVSVAFVHDFVVAAILRLIGHLGQIGLKEGCIGAVKNVATVINTFIKHSKQEGVPWGVQLAAVYATCDLSPSNPKGAVEALLQWREMASNSIPTAADRFIEEICTFNNLQEGKAEEIQA